MEKSQLNKRLLGFALLIALVALLFSASNSAQALDVYRLYHPNFLKNYSLINSTFSMVNGSAAPATSVATLYSLNPPGFVQTLIPAGLGPRQGFSLRSQDMSGVSNGIYSLIASSDQPVETVVNIYRALGNLLSIYRGLPGGGATQMVIGPFYKSSGGILQNTAVGIDSVVTIQYYDQGGNPVGSQIFQVLMPAGSLSFLGTTNPALPADFKGMAVVSATQPIIGMTVQRVYRNGSPVVNSMTNVQQSVSNAFIPRALKGVDEDGGPRSTRIFIGFPSASTGVTATGTLFFLDAAGQEVTHSDFILGANQSTEIALDALPGLSEGGVYGVRMVSDLPVSFNEITDYRSVSSSASAASYNSDQAAEINLPRLVVNQDSHSMLSVQNTGPGTTNLNMAFNGLDGTTLASRSTSLPQGGWVRYDLRQIAELGTDFTGTAVLNSVGSGALLSAIVDEYYIPCLPVSGLSLSRIPAGDIFTGNNVQFTVTAAGTAPFTYQWSLEGDPVEASSGLWEHIFSSPGAAQVAVQVQNQCGQAGQIVELVVLNPAEGQSDLSTSNITPSLSSVSPGSTLDYTIVLRNTGSVPADVTLVDPLPANLTYVSGSASNGGAVEWDGTSASWAGVVDPGSPIFITLTTTVQSIGVGLPLVNQATLTDSQGHSFPLMAVSTGVAGYSLLINNGDLSTNTNKVTLRYSYDPAAEIFYFKVSNDPSFTPGAHTSAWRAVDGSDPTLANWNLDVVSDLRMPYTVYIRFRSKDGIEFGAYQDEIIYDPVAPHIRLVSSGIPSLAALWSRFPANAPAQPASLTYSITVNATDLISGVSELQISLTPDFTTIARHIPVKGTVTTFDWTPVGRPTFYLRAVDRSGNVSSTVGFFMDKKVFVPSIRR